MTGQFPSFQILTCCRSPNAMGSKGSLACRTYPDTGTGTSEDVFNILAIRGPTRGDVMLGIEPGSSDPQSSPLPLRHRGGHKHSAACYDVDINSTGKRWLSERDNKKNYNVNVIAKVLSAAAFYNFNNSFSNVRNSSSKIRK